MKQLVKFTALAILLGGCATGAHYTEAAPKVPDAWASEKANGVGDSAPTSTAWWELLQDATLNGIVKRVTAANYDVRIAEARVREARATRQLVGTGSSPSATLGASWTASQSVKQKLPSTGSPLSVGLTNGPGGLSPTASIRGDNVTVTRSGIGSDAVTSISPTFKEAGIDRTTQLFQVGLDSQWEIDIFGGVRAGTQAAEADLRAVSEQRNAVLVSVLAEAALGYVELRQAQRQRQITEKNIATQEHTAQIARERFRVGLDAEFDAVRAETQLETTRAVLPQIDQSIKVAMYRLALLAGEEPDALTAELSPLAALPPAPETIAIGLPSDLLRRRADVRAAEEQLHAAEARIKVAVADLFPKFFLNSSISTQGTWLGALTGGAGQRWSLGPSMSWEILNMHGIRSNIEIQNARQEQAVVTYEKTVAVAVDEVERALTAYAKENEHRAALAGVVAGNEKSVALADERYQRGLEGFLNVLQAQAQLYASQAALADSEAAVLTNLIAVYKALGGGWETPVTAQ